MLATNRTRHCAISPRFSIGSVYQEHWPNRRRSPMIQTYDYVAAPIFASWSVERGPVQAALSALAVVRTGAMKFSRLEGLSPRTPQDQRAPFHLHEPPFHSNPRFAIAMAPSGFHRRGNRDCRASRALPGTTVHRNKFAAGTLPAYCREVQWPSPSR